MREPVTLSREEAVAATLDQLGNRNLQMVDATYTGEYEWRGNRCRAWALRLSTDIGEEVTVTVAVHACTGDLLSP
ncbi:hypothetical protein STH1819 [Symbiobacterium thermophilum IAM 14863]|uniref:PepSY domain-containing protein n=1 Tax=Symbiobacterium thermophilum (strain DSM 24528 / JCM 14929 / IAM 14863 / T) TaxID=292459 RepID=Q67ND9_SYMTH|nr:hypothetical protein STH1819 [Symbiobacterium thermophilum IAM 14863]